VGHAVRRHPRAARRRNLERPNLLTSEDLLPQPRQARSVERRARLSEAALRVFGDNGYDRASVDEIARLAEVPIGSFYQHFRSKRQILLSLMDQLLVDLSRFNLNIERPLKAREALHDLLSRSFSADVRYLGAYRAWQEAVLSDPELAAKQTQIQAWTTARAAAAFQALQQFPSARRDVDPGELAEVLDGFFWTLLGRAGHMRGAELKRAIDSTTHLVYHALFTDAAPTR
jgi:TetR/AcrR family transcriptional repressor of nem operon